MSVLIKIYIYCIELQGTRKNLKIKTKPKAIDNNTVVWGGALNIDGFTVLRSPGQFCTTAVECKNFQKLVRSEKNNEKLGDTTFHMEHVIFRFRNYSIGTTQCNR